MNFEIYCDESGLEALTRKDAHLFIAIGGIWMPADFRSEFKLRLNAIKESYCVKGELKWNKVSPAYLDLYKDVVEFFFSTDELRFRVILIESMTVDNYRFNDQDAELGFYKFYYQLLHHWIFDFNSYDIFLDLKVNRDKGRLKKLKEVLHHSNLTSEISNVQALPSNQSLGIQLADVLTGLVAAKFNQKIKSEAKQALLNLAQSKSKTKLAPTPKWEEKLNVFKINLKGGW
ncbi:MAG: DUF3800 domain-containing protein [Sphingobacteriia bacterium]|nr:DUF3800 domain-containing protein [Sphingobacteriia bacterium]